MRQVSMALGLVLLALGFSFTPLKERMDAFSVDAMLFARHLVFGQQHGPETSAAVVVALDEQTYRTAPFSGLPHVLWTPQLARVQDAILTGGAKVIGYDLILPTSIESHMPGYEKPFLLSLMKAARQGKVVLGKVQHSDRPVAPHPAQSMVVKNQHNIRALNMHSDVDDVIRRIALRFATEAGGFEPSLPLELAMRSLGQPLEAQADGRLALGDYLIPGSEQNSALLNFQGGADIPTYSLADLYACAEKGDAEYFQRQFQDKVVLFGMVLDVEDRKLTSKRLMTESGAGAEMKPCVLSAADRERSYRRDSIPGVYILATAVNDFLRQDFLSHTLAWQDRLLLGGIALMVCLLSLALPSAWSALAIGLLSLFWFVGSLLGLQFLGFLLPVFSVLSTVAISYALMLMYRYLVADQQKNRIRNLFSLYLEPKVVNQMLASDHLPELGGETREVTVWFSDLANFTSLSEGLSAHDLVALMNRYFSVVTDIIETHGGFVDKYIGDAIVAVFGAPHDDPEHAGHAVAAALLAREELKRLNGEGAFGGRQINTRTGINTGMAVVGNVGSSRRFNYTVMGDTVNLASRLEGANKATGTDIMISESVAEKLPDSILLRELATIRVKGKQQPTRVYEPLGMLNWRPMPRKWHAQDAAEIEPRPRGLDALQHMATAFAEALEDYRHRRFQQVLDRLQPLAGDKAAEKLMERAQQYLRQPPPADWDGVDTLSEK